MTSATLADVSVGIPTCDDDPKILTKALSRIVREPIDSTIIVDMSRGSGVRRVAADFEGDVTLIRYPESIGVSDSRNLLIKSCPTQFLIMIDADAIPRPGWAVALRKAFDRDERAAVIGGRILPTWPDAPPLLFQTAPALDFLGMYDLGESAVAVPRIMGTTYAIDRTRLPGNPPFRPDVGRKPGSLLAFEEVAYCLGVIDAGWTIWYEPQATVDHHVRRGRDSWRWMLRRTFVAGQESRLAAERLEPLPRATTMSDRLFRLAIAPTFLAGRLIGPRNTSATHE